MIVIFSSSPPTSFQFVTLPVKMSTSCCFRQVVDRYAFVNDCSHGYDRYLVVNQFFCFVGVRIDEFLFREDVGVADVSLSCFDLRQAGAAAAALYLNRDAAVFGILP